MSWYVIVIVVAILVAALWLTATKLGAKKQEVKDVKADKEQLEKAAAIAAGPFVDDPTVSLRGRRERVPPLPANE
jgi:hypothetical protein